MASAFGIPKDEALIRARDALEVMALTQWGMRRVVGTTVDLGRVRWLISGGAMQ